MEYRQQYSGEKSYRSNGNYGNKAVSTYNNNKSLAQNYRYEVTQKSTVTTEVRPIVYKNQGGGNSSSNAVATYQGKGRRGPVIYSEKTQTNVKYRI